MMTKRNLIHPWDEDKAWMAASGLVGVLTGAWLPEHVTFFVAMWGCILLSNLTIGYARRERP